MANRILSGALSLAISLLSLNVGPVEVKNRANLELAAAFQLPELPKLPSLGGASADWRQWDTSLSLRTAQSILRSGGRGNTSD